MTSSSVEQEANDRSNARRKCVLVSVKRSPAPDGAAGGNWYRYIISNPGSPITGYRRGKKSDVLAYLNECTDQINDRLKTGRAPMAPRGRKSKAAQAFDKNTEVQKSQGRQNL